MKWGRGIAMVLLLVTAACGDDPAPKRAKRPAPPRTPPPPVAELEPQARAGEPEDRIRAIELLGEHRADEPDDEHAAAQQVLLELLTDPEPDIQSEAICALTSASLKTVESAVLARIRDPDDPDRESLLHKLTDILSDEEELKGRAVAAALHDPNSELAGEALEVMAWIYTPWPPELPRALDGVIERAVDPLRVLVAIEHRAGWCDPARATELVARVVAIARAHLVEAEPKLGAKIRAGVLSALLELGPEAAAARSLLLEYLIEQDHAEAFGVLAALGPTAGDAIPGMFRWLAVREQTLEPDEGGWANIGPAMQLMTWPLSYGAIGFVPEPLQQRAREQLRTRQDVAHALDIAAVSTALLPEVLEAWPWLGYHNQERALAVLIRSGAPPRVLLAHAREVWSRWWRSPSLVAAAVLLGHEVPGSDVERAEQYLRRQVAHGDESARNAVWAVLALAPPRAARRFLPQARELIRENWRRDLETPGLIGAAALLLRSGGAHGAEVTEILRQVLMDSIGVYVVATVAELAGEAARPLLPDLLAVVGSAHGAERLWVTFFLRVVGIDTVAVRAALARLRNDPWPTVRHWAVGAIYRLDNP